MHGRHASTGRVASRHHQAAARLFLGRPHAAVGWRHGDRTGGCARRARGAPMPHIDQMAAAAIIVAAAFGLVGRLLR